MVVFESGHTDDWRTLAEANRAPGMKHHARLDMLQGKHKSQLNKRRSETPRANFSGGKNVGIVALLVLGGYFLDDLIGGKRVDGRGGPLRRMIDGILSPLRRLAGMDGRPNGSWKKKSPSEMARLAAEKRQSTVGGSKSKKAGRRKKKGKR
jgi:hypothetical protein